MASNCHEGSDHTPEYERLSGDVHANLFASKPPNGVWLVLGALAVAAPLFSCLPITTQIAGWPQDLTIRIHQNAGFAEVQEKCYPSIPLPCKLLGGIATQCALIDLNQKTCDIYTIWGEASEHELSHCRGGDHDGMLQAYFDRWKCAHGLQGAPQ